MSVRISEWHSVQCVVSLQGVVPEPLQWPCLPACRSQLVTGRWLLDSSPVSTFRAVTLVRTVSHLPARALRVHWGHTSGGFAGPSSARSAELGSSGSAAATQADCCVGFYGEKTRGICGAREEAEAPGSKTDRAAWAGRGGRGRRGSPLPGREEGGSVRLRGACEARARPPARVGPVRGVWGCGDTGPCWGSASWGPARGGLRQPHGNPRPASAPVQLGGAGWLRSDHSLSLPADPSSPASAASFCAGAPAFPQCVGGLEMRGPRTGPSWLLVPWLGTAS